MSRMERFVGLKELRQEGWRKLWKPLVAEMVGTELLVLTAVGAGMFSTSSTYDNVVKVSLAATFAVAVLVETLAPVSGGHINPAVTIGFIMGGKMSLLKGLLYIVNQVLGAILGAGMLSMFVPEHLFEGGITKVHPDIGSMKAMSLECFITLIFVMVIFALVDENRPQPKTSPGLMIGLTVGLGHLFAMTATGASMNPARSFGPAIIKWVWADHWVYWVGPLSGGMSGAFMYNLLLAPPPRDEAVQQEDNNGSTKRNTAESGC